MRIDAHAEITASERRRPGRPFADYKADPNSVFMSLEL